MQRRRIRVMRRSLLVGLRSAGVSAAARPPSQCAACQSLCVNTISMRRPQSPHHLLKSLAVDVRDGSRAPRRLRRSSASIDGKVLQLLTPVQFNRKEVVCRLKLNCDPVNLCWQPKETSEEENTNPGRAKLPTSPLSEPPSLPRPLVSIPLGHGTTGTPSANQGLTWDTATPSRIQTKAFRIGQSAELHSLK
ncbi:unnamed protein product [Pleuronectes platessa]|uniref:Uncharacterized protein n=1 Tax=Pleuronectes platessa TaxID=8262 RepID=A0A9N7YBZ5_PLEPL|nr:unnamed protein product [Pleuronectes platessa]